MSDTAIAEVSKETGEILEPFALDRYLKTLDASGQNKLAAAYDAACLALLGPNDIQLAQGRRFKKKSAWLKLGRYFGISTYIPEDRTKYAMLGDTCFIATVVARAVAPWGQTSENIGSCATDEATGRRVISKADAIATAATRALNRAISNLIAMGEVSAEEVQKQPREEMPEAPDEAPTVDVACPYDPKHRRIKDLAVNQLRWLHDQLAAKVEDEDDKAQAWLTVVLEEIDRRKKK